MSHFHSQTFNCFNAFKVLATHLVDIVSATEVKQTIVLHSIRQVKRIIQLFYLV